MAKRWLWVAVLGVACSGAASNADKGADTDGGTGPADDSADSATPLSGPQYFAELDEDKGRLPDGIVFYRDNLYVGMGPTGEILKLDSRGRTGGFSTLPAPAGGHLGGLTVDIDGNLYAALSTQTEGATTGLYRVEAGTGADSLVAGHPDLVQADAVALDSALRVYLSDPSTGTLFKYDGGAALQAWSTAAALAGDPAACGDGSGAPQGVSGLIVKGAAVYFTHADTGAIYQIPVNSDNTAGEPVLVMPGDCALAGLRGITRTVGGRVFAVAPRTNRVVEIDLAAGTWAELAADGQLDEPVSVVVDEGRDPIRLYITNSAATRSAAGEPARPGVLALDLP